jgi:hypothetical protein
VGGGLVRRIVEAVIPLPVEVLAYKSRNGPWSLRGLHTLAFPQPQPAPPAPPELSITPYGDGPPEEHEEQDMINVFFKYLKKKKKIL